MLLVLFRGIRQEHISFQTIIFSDIRPREGLMCHMASLVVQMVKNPPTMWKTWVRSLDWEDPLEEGMATHSNILSWRIPWTEEPGGLQSMGSQRVRHD